MLQGLVSKAAKVEARMRRPMALALIVHGVCRLRLRVGQVDLHLCF
jgi:hypothetical protein